MTALRRAGWATTELAEWEVIPLRWRSFTMRVLARGIRSLAAAELGRELVRLAKQLHPEFVLVFKGAFLPAASILELQDLGIACYCFYPDVSFRVHGPRIPKALPLYDWVFTTKTFGLRDMREQLGVRRSSVLPHAYDPEVHRPLELTPADHTLYDCDVSFIGTWSPKKESLLRGLAEHRPERRLRIWGLQWDRAATGHLHRAVQGHEITGDEYVRAIAASTINLAILSERRVGSSDGDQITSRTFHIPASGGFMLHERTPELLELFQEDVDVACFSGLDELVSQVDRYLADDERRSAIAAHGRAAVESQNSWDHRIRVILDLHESRCGGT